jgi:hypothetical protein
MDIDDSQMRDAKMTALPTNVRAATPPTPLTNASMTAISSSYHPRMSRVLLLGSPRLFSEFAYIAKRRKAVMYAVALPSE